MIELKKSPVVFDEENHRYFLGEKELQGVTSTLIRRAFPDKYKEVDAETLAKAAKKGHELHEAIEFYDHFGQTDNDDPRIASYERLKNTHELVTVANEYLVSDEENYASSIDIVMLNKDGEFCLVDTKTTFELDTMSARLQLSIYKRFFERQNPGLEVRHIYVLWLPNRDTTIAELNELPFVPDNVIDLLIDSDKTNLPFDGNLLYGNLPAKLSEVEDEVIRIDKQLKECKEREENLKKGLYDIMAEYDIKSFRGHKLMITRVLPTVSESLDTAKLKEEMPEIYEKYKKTSNRKGSLKITIL